MTTCIHMATKPFTHDDEALDFCRLKLKLCLLMAGDKCEAQEESEEE